MQVLYWDPLPWEVLVFSDKFAVEPTEISEWYPEVLAECCSFVVCRNLSDFLKGFVGPLGNLHKYLNIVPWISAGFGFKEGWLMGRVIIRLTIYARLCTAYVHLSTYLYLLDIDFEPHNDNVGPDCKPRVDMYGGWGLQTLSPKTLTLRLKPNICHCYPRP